MRTQRKEAFGTQRSIQFRARDVYEVLVESSDSKEYQVLDTVLILKMFMQVWCWIISFNTISSNVGIVLLLS